MFNGSRDPYAEDTKDELRSVITDSDFKGRSYLLQLLQKKKSI